MFLSKISINNFRSIQHLDVNLQRGLNVFVGRNNVGKTSILDALRHAVGPASNQGETIWLEEDDFYRQNSTVERAELISITLTFDKLTEKQRTTFYEIVDFDLINPNNSKAFLHFNASWPKGKRHASIKRTGGPICPDMVEVPQRILENIPVVFLRALRNAETALAPGYKSLLASLLKEKAVKIDKEAENRIVSIYSRANSELNKDPLITPVVTQINQVTEGIAGCDYAKSNISASEASFGKILNTLQLLLQNEPIASLKTNGLGLNNLLYISVVLQHLESISADECPLLLVEEPEAHLHPQLTLLLSTYLSNKLPASNVPQTLITTHSPTLVTNVPINQMHALFQDGNLKQIVCRSLSCAKLDEKENRMLQRMLDITRSTLYFARGIILVEGISECLLIPALAKRIGIDLEALQISVIPICGVNFGIFKKLFDPDVFGIPVAIITDGDPPIQREKDATWESDYPEIESNLFKVSDRTKIVITDFKDVTTVKVCPSELTLEYDLAKAGENNALTMAIAWEQGFKGTPGTFNKTKIVDGLTVVEKALLVWRGVCRASNSGSKADLAHNLTTNLLEKNKETGAWQFDFTVPVYIQDAIRFVCDFLKARIPS